MRRTGLLHDVRFLDHDTGDHHPESPARLAALETLFERDACRDLVRVDPCLASEADLRLVHSHDHVAAVAASARRTETWFDGDTPASAGSFEAARLAAGGALAMADAVLDGGIDNGFAALRPPGHHAETTRPMGFCLFNNVAIVARHLVARRGLSRVLVLDWDVHHGNGTQNTFYDQREVLFVSLHQYPFYPGTGSPAETGRGGAAGTTVNVPMPAGAGDAEYRAAFRELVLPIAEEYAPQFVLVSAGYDAHRRDPLASLQLGTGMYGEMTDALSALAEATADGRLLLLLEGGYDLTALVESVEVTLGHLREPRRFVAGDGELTDWGRRAREAQSPHWERI